MDTAPLYLAISTLFLLVLKLHKAQLDECKRQGRSQQRQIDALIDGEPEKARESRETEEVEALTKARAKIRRWRKAIGLMLILIPLLSLLTGCADSRQDERQQQTANAAATIYEAAVAVEQGVPAALPLGAIKANASAICTANGHPYPPAAPAAPAPKASP